MWELDHKEGWVTKNWFFWTVVLEKTLESPLDSKEMKPVNLKEINPEYSLEGLILKFQYCGHVIWRADSMENTLILGKIESRRKSGWQRMRRSDGITELMDMSLSKLQETVKDREAWHATGHGVTKIQIWLSNWTELKRLEHPLILVPTRVLEPICCWYQGRMALIMPLPDSWHQQPCLNFLRILWKVMVMTMQRQIRWKVCCNPSTCAARLLNPHSRQVR